MQAAKSMQYCTLRACAIGYLTDIRSQAWHCACTHTTPCPCSSMHSRALSACMHANAAQKLVHDTGAASLLGVSRLYGHGMKGMGQDLGMVIQWANVRLISCICHAGLSACLIYRQTCNQTLFEQYSHALDPDLYGAEAAGRRGTLACAFHGSLDGS
jgi:hypothetical protein